MRLSFAKSLFIFVLCLGFLPSLQALNASEIHEAAKKGDIDKVNELLAANPELLNSKDNKMLTPLHWAALKSQEDVALRLLELKANVGVKDQKGKTPLHLAIAGENLKIAEAIINAGADINARQSDGETPLCKAASYKNIDIAKLLVKHGADPKLPGAKGWRPLHYAMRRNHKEMAECLVSAGTPVDVLNDEYVTPLQLAVTNNFPVVVETMIKLGADINFQGFEKSTALHFACFNDRIDVLNTLLKAGANVNIKNQYGATPLGMAAQKNSPGVALILASNKKVDVDNRDVWNQSPLYLAAISGYLDVAKKLIERGAKVNLVQSVFGNTPLHHACSRSNFELVKLLVESGSDINVQDKDRRCPFIMAIQSTDEKYEEIGLYLIDKGCNVDLVDNEELRPIHVAMMKQSPKLTKAILDKGVKFDALVAAGVGDIEKLKLCLANNNLPKLCKEKKWEPIHFAAAQGQLKTIDYLLSAGSDLEAKASLGSTPALMAAISGNLQSIRHLKDKGADILAVDNNGNNILHRASQFGFLDIVTYCLEQGFNINSKNNSGATPLYFAASHNHPDVVALLIKNKAAPNCRLKSETVAFNYACEKGYTEVVKLLLAAGADANMKDKNRNSIFFAACNDRAEALDYLLSNINGRWVKDSMDQALVSCAHFDTSEGIRVLLKHGAFVSQPGRKGQTPLHVAILQDSYNAARVLLENGADLQAGDYKHHRTPKEMAEHYGRYRILKLIEQYTKSKPSAADMDRF